MTVLAAALVVVGVVAVGLGVALGMTVRSLRRARERIAELEASLVEVEPRTTATTLAGRAVRAVVTTASRLRADGVGGMLASSLDDLERWAREDRARIVRVAGPDGTVTIVFTDIEDSTPRNDELGDERWVRVLEAHGRVVRAAVERHGGLVVKNQGDGYMIAVGDPGAAVALAVEIQRRLTDPRDRTLRRTPVRVRIGLHAGRVVSRDGDFYGRNVAIAARVAALAAGGEVLATDEVVAALGPDAPPTDDRGEQVLKGVSEGVRVHAVRWRPAA